MLKRIRDSIGTEKRAPQLFLIMFPVDLFLFQVESARNRLVTDRVGVQLVPEDPLHKRYFHNITDKNYALAATPSGDEITNKNHAGIACHQRTIDLMKGLKDTIETQSEKLSNGRRREESNLMTRSGVKL